MMSPVKTASGLAASQRLHGANLGALRCRAPFQPHSLLHPHRLLTPQPHTTQLQSVTYDSSKRAKAYKHVCPAVVCRAQPSAGSSLSSAAAAAANPASNNPSPCKLDHSDVYPAAVPGGDDGPWVSASWLDAGEEPAWAALQPQDLHQQELTHGESCGERQGRQAQQQQQQQQQQLDTPEAVLRYVTASPRLQQVLGISHAGALAALRHTQGQGQEQGRQEQEQGQGHGRGIDAGCQGDAPVLAVRELSGGRINYVWRLDVVCGSVNGSGGDSSGSGRSGSSSSSGNGGGQSSSSLGASVVLKWAPPYVRSVGSDFQLTQGRLHAEAAAMCLAYGTCHRHVPRPLLHDASACVLVTQMLVGTPPAAPQPAANTAAVRAPQAAATPAADASPGHPPSDGDAAVKLIQVLRQGAVLPHLSDHLALLLRGYLLPHSLAAAKASAAAAAAYGGSDNGSGAGGGVDHDSVGGADGDPRVRAIARRAERLAGANGQVLAANVAVVFDDPWDGGCPRNRPVPPEVQGVAQQMRSDPAVARELARLRHDYLTRRDALIHNDLTTGNLMVLAEQQLHVAYGGSSSCSTCTKAGGDSDEIAGAETSSGSVWWIGGDRGDGGGSAAAGGGPSTHLIDWEFACYGPMAYDIGSLVGNLLLSYCATFTAVPYEEAEEAGGGDEQGLRQQQTRDREQQRRWLLQVVAEVWENFCSSSNSSSAIGSCSTAGETAMVQQGGNRTGRAAPHRDPSHPLGHAASSAPGVVSSDGAGAILTTDEMWALLDDSLGYAGCVVARLLLGMHHYPAVEAVRHVRQRATCYAVGLRLARALLAERGQRGWGGAGGRGGVGAGGAGVAGAMWGVVEELGELAAEEAGRW